MVMRVLAFVVAVAMVVGALAYRNSRTSGTTADASDTGGATSSDGADQGSGDERAVPEFDGTITLLCVSEFELVCRDLASRTEGLTARIEEGGVTEARLATAAQADVGATAWIAPSSQVEALRVARADAGLDPIVAGRAAVASSPLVLAGRSDRIAAVDIECGATIGWGCFEQLRASWNQSGWGEIKLGVPNPEKSATGLVAVGNAGQVLAQGNSQRAAQAFNAIGSRLRQPTSTSQLDSLIGQQGSFDFVVALEGDARSSFRGTRDEADLTTLPLMPFTNVELVLATIDPGAVDAVTTLVEPLRNEAQADWQPTDGGAGTLPDTASLNALRTVWVDNAF